MNATPQTNSSNLTSPPRPTLAFRVGVVGHRPNRLRESDLNQLSSLIHDILKVIKEEVESFKRTHGQFFDNAEPVLRALSPLAEGTDRLFAEKALSLGYELCCVMPFFKEEFEKDFLPGNALEDNSLKRFNDLLSKASTRFELDGSRKDNALAYGTAGEVVLNQSDILIVVWDGERQGKPGGTEETMDDAIRMGVEVIWIDARAPHSWQIINAKKPLPESVSGEPLSPTDSVPLYKIKERVKEALDLPHIDEKKINNKSKVIKDEDPVKATITFYSEKKPKWRMSGFVWKSFRDLFGDNKLKLQSLREEDFEESVSYDWSRDTSSQVARIVDTLRPFYAWMDKPAVIYSDRYRSAYIIIFLLAAFSVGMALLPVWLNYPLVASISIAAELISIVIILIIYGFGKKRQWQRRWLDYRTRG